ncbi:MAG: hypothetical protein O3B83_05190 [Bacteroidetes bacterium]|nr:hypothetical protein [Bacteroidota bacterium]
MVLLLSMRQLAAQSSNTMEEYMYSSGKIWVAITVLGIILVFIYLWRMDKKLDRMEKDLH